MDRISMGRPDDRALLEAERPPAVRLGGRHVGFDAWDAFVFAET
jgi:hypothetical protein